nr:FKBP-type peptidyl-prolyl cis-trans isomerase [uncultured Bacteroides sp.]
MKKVSIFMAIAAAATLASCTGKGPKADLKTDIDSLSYSIGMSQTQGLKDYLVQRVEMDTAYMDEFIKGLNEGVKETDKKKDAYYAGLQIGQQIKNQMIKGVNKELFGADSTKTISVDNFMAGFVAGTLGKNQKMTMQQAQEYTQKNMEAIKAKSMEKNYGANKKAGEDFLAANKAKPGIVTTASGLQYKIVKAGTGATPSDTSKVKVNYKGTLIDGTEFDSSYKRNEPATFVANQVIKGWTEALKLMPVGSKWIIYVPQNLAYGSRDAGQIKPFSTLVFEVELLEIVK